MATQKKNLPATIAGELNTEAILSLFADATVDWTNIHFTVSSSEETAARIAARDLEANSLDELLGGSDTISGKNYVGRPFCAVDVEWQASNIDGEGLPFYAVIHASNIDGESITITCGGRSVVRKLAVMKAKSFFPAWIKLVQGEKTENGYYPLDIAKAAAPEEAF